MINGNSWGVVGCPGTGAGKGVASEVGTNFQYWVGGSSGLLDLEGSEMSICQLQCDFGTIVTIVMSTQPFLSVLLRSHGARLRASVYLSHCDIQWLPSCCPSNSGMTEPLSAKVRSRGVGVTLPLQ